MSNWELLANRADSLGSGRHVQIPTPVRLGGLGWDGVDSLGSGRRARTRICEDETPSMRKSADDDEIRCNYVRDAVRLLEDACALLRVERTVELIPVLGEVVRIAVTVPELQRFYRWLVGADEVLQPRALL